MSHISRRRVLLSSAGALLMPRKGRSGPLPTPPKTPRQLNLLTGRTQLVSVGNRSDLNGVQQINELLLNASGNPIEEQLCYVAPAAHSISAIQIGLPGFFVDVFNECVNTLTIQWRAAVEYPIGTTLMDVTWDGQPTLTLTPAHKIYWSDTVNVAIPAGGQYNVRLYGIIQGMCLPAYQITVSGGAITAIGAPALSSLTWANGTVYATTAVPHGYVVGTTVPMTIAATTPSGYSGSVQATITGASTFSYALATNPGAETVPGTWSSQGQGLHSVPALSLSGLGSGTGGALSQVFNFSVSPRISITNQGTTQYTSRPTVTSSGGGGSVQPTWTARIKNGWLADVTMTSPGSDDFTSAPTLAFSGGGGTGAAATCYLTGGQLVGTPTISAAGSGYTNGTYLCSYPTGGINMWPGMGTDSEQLGTQFAFFGNSVQTAVDNTPSVDITNLGYYNFFAFNPLMRAIISGPPSPCVGIIGTSIERGFQDANDFNGVYGEIARSLAGDGVNGGTGGKTSGIPYINISRGSSNVTALLGSGRGQLQTLIDTGVTHTIVGHPTNDFAVGLTASQCLVEMQQLWNFLLDAGFVVSQCTQLPRTTSTDFWATIANQTPITGTFNVQRLLFNAAIRANFATYGINIIDIAAFFEYGGASSPSGVWNVTGNPGAGAAPQATISGGAVSTLFSHVYSGNPSTINYLAGGSGTVPLTFFGGGGSGAAGTATVVSGAINPSTGYTLTANGSGYITPPLVGISGALTHDGVHPSTWGYLQGILSGLFSPSQFSL